jgi:hypothetical protein
MTDILEKAAECLRIATAAFERIQREPPPPGALYSLNKGCERRCPSCLLECAVIAIGVRASEQEYAEALAKASAVLMHGGRHFSTMAGSA